MYAINKYAAVGLSFGVDTVFTLSSFIFISSVNIPDQTKTWFVAFALVYLYRLIYYRSLNVEINSSLGNKNLKRRKEKMTLKTDKFLKITRPSEGK